MAMRIGPTGCDGWKRRLHAARRLLFLSFMALAICIVTGCSAGALDSSGSGAEATQTSIPHGGAAVAVRISQAALESTPAPWKLETPEDAVRSYLGWVSYAYRIAQSDAASPTMTTYQAVRDDSYIQYNVQKGRILDQQLDDITFDKASVGSTSTLLPARERWSYRYVSIERPGEVIGGPYTASYDSTYTVVRSADGGWRVDNVEAKPLGEVK